MLGLGCWLLMLGACDGPQRDITLQFAAVHGGRPIACDTPAPALTDLRFYISNIALIEPDGTERALAIDVLPPWQNRHLGMLDLETGSGRCSDGTPAQNTVVSGRVPERDYTAVRFTLGVPFELNHANPLQAEAPLDDPAMHWHWRSGYKFLRAGIALDDAEAHVHIGSSGCEGSARKVSRCRSPNRLDVRLDDFDPDTDRIAVDLAPLLSIPASGTRSCLSGPGETDCDEPFDALGLRRGEHHQPRGQRVFGVLRQ